MHTYGAYTHEVTHQVSSITSISNLVPRLPRNVNLYCWESLVYFLRKHDVIKIGLKQKGHVVQPTMRSTLGVYDIQLPITNLVTTFALFPVLSLRYANAQLRSLYPVSTFGTSHVRKILGSPRLHNFNVCIPEHGSLGTRLKYY